MGAEFHVVYEDQIFRIRIDRDGSMDILEPQIDLEHDIAFTAMGGKASPALQLTNRWESDPITIITNYILDDNMPEMSPEVNRYILGLDWAEHTLGVYLTQLPDKHQRDAVIRALRVSKNNYLRGNQVGDKLRRAISGRAGRAGNDASNRKLHQRDASIAWSAWYSIAALSSAIHADPRRSGDRAALAFALKKGAEEFSEEYQTRHSAEQAWQIRRFVHIAEELQAGRPWPPLGATR